MGTEQTIAVTSEDGQASCREQIDRLMKRAQQAASALLTLGQVEVDHIVHAMARAGEAERLALARLAVEETGMGVFEDKVIKNQFATEYMSLKTATVCDRMPSSTKGANPKRYVNSSTRS